ncbi:hypothetical protein OOT46_12410 [Aquabacterium sp. A7-Y]|uniref:hypothetical protein n=1 Tax=Aquabacterium sp. A7-Y TaxID=1349605 RepID=UPI00223D735F|nr:hypothetical protein [Aquabacterium sp. A7-Y]MCW7538646.1 hypothetical protein [Aquabacterium sp. A7-Y]
MDAILQCVWKKMRLQMRKINQVTSVDQATKLADAGVDVLGCCLAAAHEPRRGRIDEGQLRAIVDSIERRTALSFDADSGYTAVQMRRVLDDHGIDFLEVLPVDPEKKTAHEQELQWLREVPQPKIASGYFLMKDDLSYLKHVDYFKRLMDAGVAYFQFEIDSLIDPKFKIGRADAARVERFFEEIPCLVCDRWTALDAYPSQHARGRYMNITAAALEPGQNYDYSQLAFPFSQVLALLQGRRIARSGP